MYTHGELEPFIPKELFRQTGPLNQPDSQEGQKPLKLESHHSKCSKQRQLRAIPHVQNQKLVSQSTNDHHHLHFKTFTTMILAYCERQLKLCLVCLSVLLCVCATFKLILGIVDFESDASLIAGLLLLVIASGTLFGLFKNDLAVLSGLFFVYGLFAILVACFLLLTVFVENTNLFTRKQVTSLIGLVISTAVFTTQTLLLKLFLKQHRGTTVDISVIEVT